MLDVTRLRVLVAIAKHGSLTAAAAALHYTQPSISHHLSRLEAEVGTPLLVRAGRGVRLTEAGRLLARRAEEILGRLEAAGAEIATYAGLRRGTVRLAAFPSALGTVVPWAAAHFRQAYPHLELALREEEPPQALDALRAGEVDVALVFDHGATATGADMTVQDLFVEPLYLVTPVEETGPVDLEYYRDRRWIAGCDQCRAHLLAECARHGFTPQIGFTTDDYVAVQALVAAGLGVTTLPGLALVASRHDRVRVQRLPGDRRWVRVATYGRPPHAAPVAAFLEVLTATVTTVPAWP